jgi:hypothetical protein
MKPQIMWAVIDKGDKDKLRLYKTRERLEQEFMGSDLLLNKGENSRYRIVKVQVSEVKE